jgi:hypothetical protein
MPGREDASCAPLDRVSQGAEAFHSRIRRRSYRREEMYAGRMSMTVGAPLFSLRYCPGDRRVKHQALD